MVQKQPKRASKQIIQAIMEKKGVKIAQAYRMIEKAKRSKAVDVRTAANYVAAQLEIDVQMKKFGLTDSDKERLRGLLGAAGPLVPSGRQGQKGKVGPRLVPVQIGPKAADMLIESKCGEGSKEDVRSLLYRLCS